MAYPDFTLDEKYLISYVKTTEASRSTNSYTWGYMVSSSILFGLGVYHTTVALMVIAFVLVIGFRFYEEWNGNKWTPIWKGIVEKYEAAVARD